jgi:hypothetical protein
LWNLPFFLISSSIESVGKRYAVPGIATIVWQGMVGERKLAEIHDAPSHPTVADSMHAPFFIIVSIEIAQFSGK